MGYVQVEYDEEADAIAVHLRKPQGDVTTEDCGPGRYVDYDATGAVVGVEFLGVSRGITVDGLPAAEDVRQALRAIPRPD